jgi:hypothetical protein
MDNALRQLEDMQHIRTHPVQSTDTKPEWLIRQAKARSQGKMMAHTWAVKEKGPQEEGLF